MRSLEELKITTKESVVVIWQFVTLKNPPQNPSSVSSKVSLYLNICIICVHVICTHRQTSLTYLHNQQLHHHRLQAHIKKDYFFTGKYTCIHPSMHSIRTHLSHLNSPYKGIQTDRKANAHKRCSCVLVIEDHFFNRNQQNHVVGHYHHRLTSAFVSSYVFCP